MRDPLVEAFGYWCCCCHRRKKCQEPLKITATDRKGETETMHRLPPKVDPFVHYARKVVNQYPIAVINQKVKVKKQKLTAPPRKQNSEV